VPGQVPIAGEALIDWPVSLDLAFFFPRPASHFQTGRNAGTLKGSAPIWHASKPDRDNLDKAVLDALVHWHILADDSLVCHGHIIKRYLAPGMTTTPGCLIRIAHPPEVPR
jgi:Holliday junction resolvase RusA-like endonuclease